ncbi:MAG TPA: hypothetical protein VF813_09365 [Anaerolineaceae bacterium]
MNRLRIVSGLVILALTAAACQTLAVDIEPTQRSAAAGTQVALATVGSSATAPAEMTASPTSQPAETSPTSLSSQLAPAPQAGPAVRLAEIHMLDAARGWALGNRGLGLVDSVLATADGGLTWQAVTPPGVAAGATGAQAAAAFLDQAHAWVSYADQRSSPELTQAQVWSTADGGKTWTSGSLDLQSVQVEQFAPKFLGFRDAQNGWLLAHVGAGMSHEYVVIFTSADGGKTWARVVDPEKNNLGMSCVKTGLVFQTAKIGYVSGDCQGVRAGIYLSRTVDGGTTWDDVSLPAPDDHPDLFTNQANACGVETVLFPSAQDALIPVRCAAAGSSAPAQRWLYASHDGGQAFRPQTVPAQYGAFDFLDPQTGWLIGAFTSDATRFTLFNTIDGGGTWKSIANLGWRGQPDFIDAQTGWVAATSGDASALVMTRDGGATWQEIKPHLAR